MTGESLNSDRTQAFDTDSPIQTKAQDRFNRSGFASRIAEVLGKRVDTSSLVIGLYGPWGDGKTSVLEMMAESLADHSDVVTIKFNPWHFQSEEALVRGFFSTLASSLGKSLPNLREKIGVVLNRYGSLLSLASVTVADVIDLNPGGAAKGLGESLSTTNLEELRDRIEKILSESGKRVVILIDDIDRLDRGETHAIFKLVKLSAGFHRTSYVLAFDDSVVSAALGERYGQGGTEAGRAFLEKIIQVPLHLPPADTMALRQLVFAGVQEAVNQSSIELTQDMVDTFVRHYVDGLEPAMITPRQAKRYSNAAAFALPLLKGEVDTVDLLLLEGLRILYPKLYIAIRNNPTLFLVRDEDAHRVQFNEQVPTRLDQLLIENMAGTTETDRKRVKRGLLEPLFPRLGRTIYDHDWDRIWARKRRLCSEQYFKRYFSYGVPTGDIAELELDTFLNNIAAGDPQVQQELLVSFAARQAVPSLIRKLRERAELFSAAQATALIETFGANGSLLPLERGPAVLGGTRMQGSILMSQLLRKILDRAERQRVAQQLIATAEPVAFAMESLRFIRHNPERAEEERILNEEDDVALRKALAHRVAALNATAPLYLVAPKDARVLYWTITSEIGGEDLARSLTERFEAHPDEVDRFLDCFVGEGWYVETGLPVRSDLDQECYNNIAKLVPAEVIVQNLRTRYGEHIASAGYRYTDETPLSERFAHQFMNIHNQLNEIQ